MLTMCINPRSVRRFEKPPAARQQGVILLITLIVLVAMTLAAVSLVRSVNTTNVISGNLAFRESTVAAGDKGSEDAIKWLENNTGMLDQNLAVAGYYPTYQDFTAPTTTWEQYWALKAPGHSVTLAQDTAGNTVSYFIERMCRNVPTGPATGVDCSMIPTKVTGMGSLKAGSKPVTTINQVFFRITTRVEGPHHTVSYTQSFITM